jgi:hypothetical protein
MDTEQLPITPPRLSDEAIRLFFAGVCCASPVDLRPFIALQGDYRPAIIRAALAWNLPPERIEV